MSHTHAELVDPISARIAADIGLWKHWADPFGKWGRGERPDRFGMFDRMHPELWRDDEGASVKCFPGDTFVFECKVSVSDKDRDRLKKWRQKIEQGVGNFRAFVAPIGIVDPHELVGSPWGLWEVDDAGLFVMRRAPMRVNQVNHGHQNILLAKLVGDTNQPGQGTRNGAPKAGGVKPHYHDAIHTDLSDHGELTDKELALRLHERDPALSPSKAMAVVEAFIKLSKGVTVEYSGQDRYLKLREPQTTEV